MANAQSQDNPHGTVPGYRGVCELRRMTILLLHGALATKEQMDPLAERLRDQQALSLTFSGHGPRANEPLDFARFVDDIGAVMAPMGGAPIHLFGYSMGGYAALLYAARFPDRVLSVTTLGTILVWTEEILQKELRKLDPDMIEQKVPVFAHALAGWHGKDRWRDVVLGIAARMSDLARSPLLTPKVLERINCPVLCFVGDGDTGADPLRTAEFASRLQDARSMVIPDTRHPFEDVDLDILVPELRSHCRRAERG